MKLLDIKLLEAAPKPQKTANKVQQDWDSLFGSSADSTMPAAPKQSKPAPAQKQPTKRMDAVSGERTRQRMSNVVISPEVADRYSQIDLDHEDTIDNEQAYRNAGLSSGQRPDDETSGNMLTTMSNAIQQRGGVVPEWHMVKHLPGYLASGIRSMGRAVFGAFTSTPIEEIQVLADLGGGPNDKSEIDAVAQYLRDSGERDSEAELEFFERIPNYTAKVKIYKATGYTFMVVKDFAGNYIYAWPTKDGDGLSGKTGQRRLK